VAAEDPASAVKATAAFRAPPDLILAPDLPVRALATPERA
jgi:hypothetical protein